ncbi:MAG: TetR/AcrR family transcriptional regulator [Thermodesulfobacteriota bacterium]|nr:TetR/AcrR family transcriptional regulator [Thermodesulfobacteriota bacterium]
MSRKNLQNERRQQILNALHKRLLLKPFDQTSIKEIAEEAGLNHGMLHYYFKSKKEILLAYIDHSIDMYSALYADWLQENRDKCKRREDILSASLDFMTQKITFNRDLSRIFIEIWEIGNYNEKVKHKLKEAYREWISTASGFLADQLDDSEIAKQLSIAVVAISEGLSLLSIIFEDDEFAIEPLVKMLQSLLH